jgi:hypothetical protein
MKLITASNLLTRTEKLVGQAYGLRGIPGMADSAIIVLDTFISYAQQALPWDAASSGEASAAYIEDILDEMSTYGPYAPPGIPDSLWAAIRSKLERTYTLLTAV